MKFDPSKLGLGWRVQAALMAPLLAVAGIAALAAAEKADISELAPQDLDVTARRIAFDSTQPDRREFGRLIWRGSMVVTSSSDFFGGYSGLALDSKGEQFLAVSDSGSWLSGRLAYEDGRLVAMAQTRIGPITQKDGRPIQKKSERDAEALTVLKPGALDGRYLVAFEERHRLEEYAFEKGAMRGPLAARPMPASLKGMSSNAGLEAAAVLRGGPQAGALLLFAERKLTPEGHHTGGMIKDGKAHSIFLKRHEEYDLTDMQSLADGSVVVLERSFNRAMLRLGIRLRLIKAADVKPGAVMEGETLFQTGHGLEIDNFEGLAVHETAKGESVITLISDDNFSFLQRTLLVQFLLK